MMCCARTRCKEKKLHRMCLVLISEKTCFGRFVSVDPEKLRLEMSSFYSNHFDDLAPATRLSRAIDLTPGREL
jgi:hypothetical protein